MNIQYCSDLHLEFRENKNYLAENPIKPVGEILILAGDLVPFALMHQHKDFFDYVSDHFEQTYWLPGNHEYYHSDLADRCGSFCEKIRNNVLLVNNYKATHEYVNLVFSTLWTELSIKNQALIQQGMSDFHVIRYKGRPLTPIDYNEQHALCLAFIRKQLKNPADKTIVVTHHVPTFLNYPEQYKGDVLNEAFAVELFDDIEPSGIDCWIYGHHHQNIPTFKIGATNVVTNQLGYVKYQEYYGFNHQQIIELKQ